MKNSVIQKSSLDFLSHLSENNNREWFTDHKADYVKALQNMCEFADELILEMNKHDVLEEVTGKKSLYRIYNDVRFSKDKSPYNPRFAFRFARATKFRRGGYYLQLKPNDNIMACGFFAPNPDDLKTIRLDMEFNYEHWFQMLNESPLSKVFELVTEQKVATTPKGFSANHPAIELIRNKQLILIHKFSNEDVLKPDFVNQVSANYQLLRPFLNYMSDLLTTDKNGELMQ